LFEEIERLSLAFAVPFAAGWLVALWKVAVASPYQAMPMALLGVCLLVAASWDLRHQLIPWRLTAGTIVAGMLIAGQVSGMVVGFLIMDSITHMGNRIRGYRTGSLGLAPMAAAVPWLLVAKLTSLSLPWIVWGLLWGTGRFLLHRYGPPLRAAPVYVVFVATALWVGASHLLLMMGLLAAGYVIDEIAMPAWARFTGKASGDSAATHPSVFGGGDASLLAAIGSWLGPIAAVYILEAALLLAGMWLLLRHRAGVSGLPFGPFLASGTLAWVLAS
jgi:prepilin signal peptidase PulO-like enzyme (type II secretory pathway)